MSLNEFQRALADLIAHPQLNRDLRVNPQKVLTSYDLTSRESFRLLSVSQQRGMRTSCSLYRVNRLTPIFTLLPKTCVILKGDLRLELDVFLEKHEKSRLQYVEEVKAFANHLFERLSTREISNVLLKEVLEFEVAQNELRYASQQGIQEEINQSKGAADGGCTLYTLHPLIRVVHFVHDPKVLFYWLTKEVVPQIDMAIDDYYVLLDAQGGHLKVLHITPQLGQILLACQKVHKTLNSSEIIYDYLINEGYLIRSCN